MQGNHSTVLPLLEKKQKLKWLFCFSSLSING
jgi:hypothetical protein